MTHIRRGLHGIGSVLIPIALVLAACSGSEVAVAPAAEDQQEAAAADEEEEQADDAAVEEDADAGEEEGGGDTEASDATDEAEEGDTDAPAPTSPSAPKPATTDSKPATSGTKPAGTDAKPATSTPAPRRVTTHGFKGSTNCAATTQQSPGAYFVAPKDGAAVGPGPVKVEFVGCSDTFEANVIYEAYHGHNSQPTLSGYTMGGTLGDWAEFRFTETFWTPGRWRVVLLEEDAESGKLRHYDEVTFTVAP